MIVSYFHTIQRKDKRRVIHFTSFSPCSPFGLLLLGDIFKQAISPVQCVGYDLWIFIGHWRRCRRFNLDFGVISIHTDLGHDLETANRRRVSLNTQLSWTHIINVRLIKVVPSQDWAWTFLTRFTFNVPFWFFKERTHARDQSSTSLLCDKNKVSALRHEKTCWPCDCIIWTEPLRFLRLYKIEANILRYGRGHIRLVWSSETGQPEIAQ